MKVREEKAKEKFKAALASIGPSDTNVEDGGAAAAQAI